MSDLSQIEHNFIDLIQGKTDFTTMLANDGKVIEARIASVPAALQPALNDLYSAFKTQASSAVALGQSAIGTVIADTENGSLETLLLNLFSKVGIPATGMLSVAEQAAAMAIVNGLHALLNRYSVMITTPTAPASSAAASPPTEPQSTT